MGKYNKHINVKAKREIYISFKKLALDRSMSLPELFEEIYREYTNNHNIQIDTIVNINKEQIESFPLKEVEAAYTADTIIKEQTETNITNLN